MSFSDLSNQLRNAPRAPEIPELETVEAWNAMTHARFLEVLALLGLSQMDPGLGVKVFRPKMLAFAWRDPEHPEKDIKMTWKPYENPGTLNRVVGVKLPHGSVVEV